MLMVVSWLVGIGAFACRFLFGTRFTQTIREVVAVEDTSVGPVMVFLDRRGCLARAIISRPDAEFVRRAFLQADRR